MPPPTPAEGVSTRCSTMGTRKARVFPVPVRARATTSRPASIGLTVAAWTWAVRALTRKWHRGLSPRRPMTKESRRTTDDGRAPERTRDYTVVLSHRFRMIIGPSSANM